MNREPVLFRVDGTPQTGWERLYRCQVYAAALQRRRRPAFFLSQLEPGALALPLKRSGNDWLQADAPAGSEDDLNETMQEIRRLRPAAIIVDAPGADEHYLAELVGSGTLVVSIDHVAHTRFYSQLVINPLLGLLADGFDLVPGNQVLAGRRYSLVRPEIRRARAMRSQEPPQPFRALVALGEDVAADRVLDIAKLLVSVPELERIDLVLRPQHGSPEEVQEFVAAHPGRLELATEPAEVTGRLARCHFAITSADSWSLELACVGIPQLLIVHDEGHWPTARRLEDDGTAICLSDSKKLSASTLASAVQDLLADPLERQSMSRCGRKLIDGRGPDRLVTALEILLHPSRALDFSEAA